MGNNTRYDPGHQRREAERDRQQRAEAHQKAELKNALLTALTAGPDAIFLVQRAAGHDLARLRLLHPDVRFVSSTGEPADRIVEVPVEVPRAEPFDPHEISNAELLRIVRTLLWEETRIEPGATYVASLCLIDLSNEKSCLKASTPKWPQQRLFFTFLSCIRLCGLSLEKHDARRKLPLRIEQAERVALIGLLGGLTARLGNMAGNASGPKRSREAGS